MAFMRKQAVVEAADLAALAPEEAQRRIIAGVKKYATHEANFAAADANTPYLGSLVGMGIESSNLADITMSIERQFLTRMTVKAAAADGSGEAALAPGELGKLRILDGQDALAATPGLSVKMLMDLGHMPKSEAYLEGVVSFAYVMACGDAWRMADALRRALARAEKLSGPERAQAAANLAALRAQAAEYDALLADPAALAASKGKAYEADRLSCESLKAELAVAQEKLRGASAGADAAALAKARADEAEIRTRLRMASAKLRVSRESAEDAGRRRPVDQAKVDAARAALRAASEAAAAFA